MIKKILVAILTVLVVLSVFSCSSSPTAMKIGSSRVDAAEYAYYLNLNRLSADMQTSGTVLNADELLARAHELTQQQIIQSELIRQQCEVLDLELTREEQEQIELDKEALIESLEGSYGYLTYLRENAMTDRLYDKLQEGNYYHSRLYDYLTEGEDSIIYNDQALRQFFSENYIKVKYIRLSTLDETGAPRSDDERNALHEQAKGILTQIQNGTLDFDYAMATYNDDSTMTDRPTGITVSTQDALGREYITDAFALADGEIGGVYAYSDGYYIIQRLAVDANYYDENRERIAITAADWSFNNYLEEVKANTTIVIDGVCKKITFENLKDYVK